MPEPPRAGTTGALNDSQETGDARSLGPVTQNPYTPRLSLVVFGIAVIALTLRGPIVAMTPVLRWVADDLSLGAGAAGILVTMPVLAFAAASPLAALIIRRVGPEAAILLTLLGISVSQLVRAVPTPVTLFGGTVALGLAITLGNIVVPVVIQRDVPVHRVGITTGVYTAMLNAGSLLTALATAPLAEAVGWPWALAWWSSLALVALAVWAVLVRRRWALRGPSWNGAGVSPGVDARKGGTPSPQGAEATDRPRRVSRLGSTWLLAATFALQSFAFYAYTTWLPTYLLDSTGVATTQAGALASTFQAWGIVGGFLIPLLVRHADLRWTAGVVGILWLTFSIGLFLDRVPVAVLLVFGGIGQAGGLIFVFSAVAIASRSPREAAAMSALVQTSGYVVAASAGPVIGALRESTGAWALPLELLAATTMLFTALSLIAAFRVHTETVRLERSYQ